MILALYLSTPTSETRKSLRSMSSLGSLRKSEGGLGRLSLCLAELDLEDREMENSRYYLLEILDTKCCSLEFVSDIY